MNMFFFSLLVGDGTRYYMRGCALRGRVSRKQGRDCIERVGKNHKKILNKYLSLLLH